MSALLQRLAQLKEAQNTSIKSDSKEATPLWVFLHLYNKARSECYVDRMEGAKILYEWLSPLDIPEYPTVRHAPSSFIIGYELTELAKIVSGYKSANQLEQLQDAELSILITSCTEFLQGVYS